MGIKGEWVWPYTARAVYSDLGIPFALFFIFIYCLKKYLLRGREIFVLAGLLIFAILFQVSIGLIGPFGLYEYVIVTITPKMSAFFAESLKIEDIISFLKDYPVRMEYFNFHANGYPPGPIMYFYLINRFFERVPSLAERFLGWVKVFQFDPDYLFDPNLIFIAEVEEDLQMTFSTTMKASAIASSFLILLIASLTVIPLYLLAREMYNREVSLTVSALYMLMPSMILFMPGFDVVFPLFTVTGIYFLYRGMKSQRYSYFFIAGVIISIGLFFSLNQIVTLLFMGLFYLFYLLGSARCGHQEQKESSKRLFRHMGLSFFSLIGGIMTMLLIYRLLLGLNLVQILNICRINNLIFNVDSGRTYSKWIIFNLVEFSLFIGVAVSIFLAYKSFCQIRRFTRDKNFWSLEPLWLSFILVLAALNFSGQNLGEIARLWIFLMPVGVLLASNTLVELNHLRRNTLLLVVMYQFIQTIVFKLSIAVHTL